MQSQQSQSTSPSTKLKISKMGTDVTEKQVAKNWTILENSYRNQTRNDKILVDLALSFYPKNINTQSSEKQTKSAEKMKNILINLKAIMMDNLDAIIKDGRFMKNSSMYYRTFPDNPMHQFPNEKDLKKHYVCTHFSLDLFAKIHKHNNKCMTNKYFTSILYNIFCISAKPDHVFLCVIADDHKCIMIDPWDKNLICELKMENLIKHSSLSEFFDFKIYDEFSKKNLDSELVKNYGLNNLIDRDKNKEEILINHLQKINNDIRDSKHPRVKTPGIQSTFLKSSTASCT